MVLKVDGGGLLGFRAQGEKLVFEDSSEGKMTFSTILQAIARPRYEPSGSQTSAT
jgi:hypothetical protein